MLSLTRKVLVKNNLHYLTKLIHSECIVRAQKCLRSMFVRGQRGGGKFPGTPAGEVSALAGVLLTVSKIYNNYKYKRWLTITDSTHL